MESINLTVFKLNIPVQVGLLNATKKKKILEILGQFDNVSVDDPSPVLLVNFDKGGNLFIIPNQITVGYEAPDIVPDFEWIYDLIKQIFDVLLLDQQVIMSIYMSATKLIGGSSMEESLSKFCPGSSDQLSKILPDVIGIGLRFLEKHDNDIWDFKVEPFINDPQRFFFEGTISYSNPTTLDQITELTGSAYKYFMDVFCQKASDALGII